MATTGSLPARVLAHIHEDRLFRMPGEALVAVSGGADSVALLDVLNTLAEELRLELVVAHVTTAFSRPDGRSAGRSNSSPRNSDCHSSSPS